MKKYILSIFFLVVTSQSLIAQTKIKMVKESGVYMVPCKINGLPLKFVFDTGASDVSISLTEAVFMIKNGYLDKMDIGENVYYAIANGDIAKGTKLNIKEIEFAGLILRNVEASIVHETSAPLLLGQSVISKLGKIQIDGEELTILTSGSNNYDYSTKNKIKSYEYSTTNYKEIQQVYTYSPILNKPIMGSDEKQIGYAENNSVFIVSRYNEQFYRVKSGDNEGYLWVGWFKDYK